MEFSSLSKRAQVERLRTVARAMLAQYPIRVAQIQLLTHLFNTTFKVTTEDGRRFALRINTNSKREVEEMNAEVAWVSALALDTDLSVPVPQPASNGSLIVEEPSAAMGRTLRGVLYSWLPGPLAKKLTPEIAFAMGEATKKLHDQARNFELPQGCALQPLKDPLFGYDYILREKAPDVDHDLFQRVFDESVELIDRLKEQPQIPIHYDIHMYNVKWKSRRLSVFDFDDSILGVPVFDAYVSLFYIRNQEQEGRLEAAYWKGLEATPESLGVSRAEFELLVASRAILLANELFRWNNPEMTAIAPKYAAITQKRLEHFYQKGIFDPLVARMS